MQLARFVFSRQNQKVSLAPKFHWSHCFKIFKKSCL
jgi:hypothetical protein